MAVIRVKVDKFTGYGTHVHVTVKVQGDSSAADADAATERVMKFRRRETALRWVHHLVETEFDPEEDTIIWDDEPTQKWFYGEGD